MEILNSTSSHLEAINKIEQLTQFSPWTTAEFERSIANPQRQAFTAMESGQVMGFAIYNVLGPEAELLTISIAPHRQGNGLGKKLLQHTLNQLKCTAVFLEVRVSNSAARALYETLGFNEVGHRANYYPAKLGREDAIIYAKDLVFEMGA